MTVARTNPLQTLQNVRNHRTPQHHLRAQSLAHTDLQSKEMSTTYVWEICHVCRRYWAFYGVSESDAIQKAVDYRAEHDYSGPLAPHSFSRKHPPVLMQEIELRTADQLAQDAAARRLGEQLIGSVAERIDDATRYERDLTGWLVNINDETTGPVEVPVMMRFGLGGSTETLWADFYPGYPDGDEAGERTELARDKDKGRQVIEPEDLEVEIVTKLRADSIGYQGFEAQDLSKQLPSRPISKILPQTPRPRSPDVNKPLPRPPRPDSPMPGLPFDSEDPERYLAKNKYYPRVI